MKLAPKMGLYKRVTLPKKYETLEAAKRAGEDYFHAHCSGGIAR